MYILIHGNDQFHNIQFLNEIILKHRQENGLNSINIIDFNEIENLHEIKLNSSLNFFSNNELTIIKYFHSSKKEFLQAKTYDYIDENQNSNIIFYESEILSPSSKLYIKVKNTQNSKFIVNELPKWENQKQEIVINFIINELKRNKIKFDTKVPFYLKEFIGDDYFHLHNEIKKFKYIPYVDLLTIDSCKPFITSNKETIIFSFINQIFSNEININKLTGEMSTHLSDSNNFMLIVSLINRELRLRRKNINEIQLKMLYNLLLDIDIDFKTGGNPKSLILKFYINLHCPKYDYKWRYT